MRTTVEITPDQRARLLEIAARRGEKGFSHLVREALESYLADEDERRKRELKLKGDLTVREGEGLFETTKRMRTTLNIDDELMKRVKGIATASGRTVTEVIEEILRREVAGERYARKRFRLKWNTVSGRLQPGVDLADRDALIERMEGRS